MFRRVFAGFPGYSETKTTIQVLVREPVTVTAIYRTEVNLGVLVILVSLPLAGALLGGAFLYLLGRWLARLMRRRVS